MHHGRLNRLISAYARKSTDFIRVAARVANMRAITPDDYGMLEAMEKDLRWGSHFILKEAASCVDEDSDDVLDE